MNPHRSRRAIQLSNNREASRLKPLPTCCVRTVPLHRKIRRTARSVVVAFILSTRDRSSSPLLRFILLPPSRSFSSPSPALTPQHASRIRMYARIPAAWIFACTRFRYASNRALDSWLPCSQDSGNVYASDLLSYIRDERKGEREASVEKVSGRKIEIQVLFFFLSLPRFSFLVEKPPVVRPSFPINKLSSSSTRGMLSIDSYARISLSLSPFLSSIPTIFLSNGNCKEGAR